MQCLEFVCGCLSVRFAAPDDKHRWSDEELIGFVSVRQAFSTQPQPQTVCLPASGAAFYSPAAEAGSWPLACDGLHFLQIRCKSQANGLFQPKACRIAFIVRVQGFGTPTNEQDPIRRERSNIESGDMGFFVCSSLN